MQWSSIGLAGLAGIVTILSPCILPILPILMGRSLQSHRLGPIFLVLGLACSFAAMGSTIGLSARFIGPLAHWIRQLAIAFLLLLGLLSAFPNLSHPILRVMSHVGFADTALECEHPLWTEAIVGTQLGVVWIPCAGPTLGAIFTLIAAEGAIVLGFFALLAFALGAGIPMLVVAYSGKLLGIPLQTLFPHTQTIQRIAGLGIVVAAIAIMMGWDVRLQLWLAPLFPPVPL